MVMCTLLFAHTCVVYGVFCCIAGLWHSTYTWHESLHLLNCQLRWLRELPTASGNQLKHFNCGVGLPGSAHALHMSEMFDQICSSIELSSMVVDVLMHVLSRRCAVLQHDVLLYKLHCMFGVTYLLMRLLSAVA